MSRFTTDLSRWYSSKEIRHVATGLLPDFKRDLFVTAALQGCWYRTGPAYLYWRTGTILASTAEKYLPTRPRAYRERQEPENARHSVACEFYKRGEQPYFCRHFSRRVAARRVIKLIIRVHASPFSRSRVQIRYRSRISGFVSIISSMKRDKMRCRRQLSADFLSVYGPPTQSDKQSMNSLTD